MSKNYSESASRFIDPYDERIIIEPILGEVQQLVIIPIEYDLPEIDPLSVGFGGLSEEMAYQFDKNYRALNGYYGRFSKHLTR